MDLIFTCEHRFKKGKDGLIYSTDSSYCVPLWERYLSVFENITVVARVEETTDNFPVEMLAQTNNVTFVELPYYVGPLDYLKKRKQIKNKIKLSLKPNSAYICRVPGNIGRLLIKELNKYNIKYGVEVVGDPWDVFAPGSISHPLRRYFRVSGYHDLKKMVKGAHAALYVTKQTLQNRYPISENAFETSVSDVQIEVKKDAEAKTLEIKEYYNLISVGSLAQMYKAPDIVLKALKILKERGVPCKLTWLGDGVFMPEIKKMAKELNIDNLISFRGNVSKPEVLKELSDSDIFLLVSRTEGLPRAMVEAMSMGLPCVGTKVGGIPELLDEKVIISPNNEIELADILNKMVTDFYFTNQQAQRNLAIAQEYDDRLLHEKRIEFYRTIISLYDKQ